MSSECNKPDDRCSKDTDNETEERGRENKEDSEKNGSRNTKKADDRLDANDDPEQTTREKNGSRNTKTADDALDANDDPEQKIREKNGSRNTKTADGALDANDDPEQKIRTLERDLEHAEEQAKRYDKLIQELRNFGEVLECEGNLEESVLEKAVRKTKQIFKTRSGVPYDENLVKAKTMFDILIKKTRTDHKKIDELEKELAKCKEDQRTIQNNYKNYQEEVQARDLWIQQQNGKLQQMTQALQKTEEEKHNLTMRLSKVAGACFTRENPNIADLSDMNRPTKLAERYSELYDNEWTDAFEELAEQKQVEEVQPIKILFDLLKVTYDECVQLTKPGREIFKTLESVSITLNPYLAQSQGNEVYGLEQSTNPNMASEMDESTNLNSRCTSKKSNEQSDEHMDVEYTPTQTDYRSNEDNVPGETESDNGNANETQMECENSTLENFEAIEMKSIHGMHLWGSQDSSSRTDCHPREIEGQDESKPENGPLCSVQESGKQLESDKYQNERQTDNGKPSDGQESGKQLESDKYQNERQTDNGKPSDGQESGEETESGTYEGQYQNERQCDNGKESDGQETEHANKNGPEGFSTDVNTGKVSAEVVIDVKFSEEQKTAVSEMRKSSFNKFETEKKISKLIAEKIAFERGIDKKTSVKVMAFITKCAELCWYMAIQEPPVVIEFHEPKDNEPFEKDKYKAYTILGDMLDYVVWPPLYLHSGGAMLSKGTAQGKK